MIKTPSLDSGPRSPAPDCIKPADDDGVESELAVSAAEIRPLISVGLLNKRSSGGGEGPQSPLAVKTAAPILKGCSKFSGGKHSATASASGDAKSKACKIDGPVKSSSSAAGAESGSRKNGHVGVFLKSANSGREHSGVVCKSASLNVDSQFRKCCCVIV